MMRSCLLLLAGSLLLSITGNSQDRKQDSQSMNESLLRMNRMLVENETKRINEFIERHQYHMSRTGTGLRYEIYRQVEGKSPDSGNVVEIKYRIFLLDGTLCYSSDSTGAAKLRIGSGEQVTGLEEGLLMMSPGDRARLILPAHMAYGMSGDRNRIPPGQALFYDLEMLSVSK